MVERLYLNSVIKVVIGSSFVSLRFKLDIETIKGTYSNRLTIDLRNYSV